MTCKRTVIPTHKPAPSVGLPGCDDTITVKIQLKDDERKVLATKTEVVDKVHSRTTTEYPIKFNAPVFLRSDDWYILSFTVTSVIVITKCLF